MLKKIYKLKSFEIKNFFNKKNTLLNSFRGVFFDLKVFKNNENRIKITIIMSSKNFKKAIFRNKTRRQIYNILHLYAKENNSFLNKNISLFVYPKKEIKNISFLDLQKEVYNSLNNLIK